MSDHVQSAKSFLSISHGDVRELTRQAIARASAIDWPLFVALRCGAGTVCCFGAAMAVATFDFLGNCADFSFPSEPSIGRSLSESEGRFPQIWDAELRSVIEKLASRSTELGYARFVGLRMPARGAEKSTCFFDCYLPPRSVEHFAACFGVVMAIARRSLETRSPQRSELAN